MNDFSNLFELTPLAGPSYIQSIREKSGFIPLRFLICGADVFRQPLYYDSHEAKKQQFASKGFHSGPTQTEVDVAVARLLQTTRDLTGEVEYYRPFPLFKGISDGTHRAPMGPDTTKEANIWHEACGLPNNHTSYFAYGGHGDLFSAELTVPATSLQRRNARWKLESHFYKGICLLAIPTRLASMGPGGDMELLGTRAKDLWQVSLAASTLLSCVGVIWTLILWYMDRKRYSSELYVDRTLDGGESRDCMFYGYLDQVPCVAGDEWPYEDVPRLALSASFYALVVACMCTIIA